MALYTRIWAGGKQSRQALAQQQASLLTIQAALEVIQTTLTPTRTELKLAYSLWEKEVLDKSAASKSHPTRRATA